jgi:hypothetical protein
MAFDHLVGTDTEGSMLFNGTPNPKEGVHCALEIALYLSKKVMRSLSKNNFHSRPSQLYHFLLC